MKWRILLCIALVVVLACPAEAEKINWVDFQVPYASLRYAMEQDIATFEQEKHIDWIDLLSLAACRTGGRCGLASVKQAASDLKGDRSVQELLGPLERYYAYYHSAYTAALGGLLGSYAIEVDGVWKPAYGLKAYSPIASGYGYSHCEDFGVSRSFGFARKHLGNDLMGALGTPVVAVEGGVVEAMGWNRYGGWRVGIRSYDGKRYYYYAHLKKDNPFAPGLQEGDLVQAGDLIGFMGRTGYSDRENTNNIETVHLHFGMELIFDESQKECNSEIWIDVYDIVRLLSEHRSSIIKTADGWQRRYPFRDLDLEEYPHEAPCSAPLCLQYMQPAVPNGKPQIKTGEIQSVDPFRVALVGGAGVVRENGDGSFPLVRRKLLQQVRGEVNCKQKVVCPVGKASGGIRMAVTVGNVGLDIEDRRAVHQIRPRDMQHGAKLRKLFHAQQADAG